MSAAQTAAIQSSTERILDNKTKQLAVITNVVSMQRRRSIIGVKMPRVVNVEW